ncbi:MAG: flagellar biosynthesis protein [Lachnospiraceae bacterium]|nr:flagellar biosynthesis protein [Lachnospiraceae bacterium]
MQERIREIPKRILEWWNKFSVKQKTLIASITIVVLIGLGIVVKVLTTPTMVPIRSCVDTKEAAQVKELLTGEDIKYEVSDDGLNFSVRTEDQANAAILLGENGIPASSYDINNVFEGGFSNTESDKSKKYQLYMEKQLEEDLEQLDVVNSATVNLSMPVDDGTVLALEEDSYAAVTLSLSGEMDEEMAAGLARWIATAIGNKGTDDISIIDSTGNMLFSGGDSATTMGAATTQLSYKNKAESMVKSQVKDVMMGTNMFNNVSVGLNLDVNFRDTKETTHRQYTEDGSEHGPVASRRQYEQETTGGVGGVPGTDTNDDDTGYMLEDEAVSSQSTTELNEVYNNNEQITEVTGGVGEINYENSSVSVVVSQYRNYNEDALRASGQLDDMTFDEFVAENRERVRMDLDDEFVQMVARATGFPEENVMVVGYEVPFFEYSDNSGRGVIDYLPVAIAIMIMIMLGYVVFRSTRREQQAVEVEPELSVESLLASTKEAEEDALEDIGFSDKSETRVLIEKFVDENPEAVASLLRNWLNEEWE